MFEFAWLGSGANLKTWFKGLGVFVASSLITSLAAANLSPSTFNFSRQGLSKLAALAAIVGLKAVALYLKQSPLPATVGPTNWSRISGALVLMLVLPATGLMTGCVNTWEKTTYATLATGKALIDCALAGYNHADTDIRQACAANASDPAFDPTQFYIAQTREAQQAIESARQAQIACVEAFEGYAVAKLAKDKTVSVADKQAAVEKYLAQLPELFQAVKGLIGTKIGSSDHRIIGSSGDRIIGPSVEVETVHDAGAVISTIERLGIFSESRIGPQDVRWPDVPINRWPDLNQEVLRGQ